MRWLGNAALALLVLAPAMAPAAELPRSAPPPPHAVPGATDTTRFLPPWLRPWIEFGGGWMAGPRRVNHLYEPGQAVAIGLEARPDPRWALRTALDYRMLIANTKQAVYLAYFDPRDPTVVSVDTILFERQTSGWIATAHAEAGARLPGDFWITAGGGGGYMRTGLVDRWGPAPGDYPPELAGEVADGWGWEWTGALRYDFSPVPRVPLGLELRTAELRRRRDAVRTWSVRLCFRMPEDLPAGSPPRPRGR